MTSKGKSRYVNFPLKKLELPPINAHGSTFKFVSSIFQMADNRDAFSAISSVGSNFTPEEPEVNSATGADNYLDEIDQDTDLSSDITLIMQLIRNGGEIHSASENHPLVRHVMATRMSAAEDFISSTRAYLYQNKNNMISSHDVEEIIRRMKVDIAIRLARDLSVDTAAKLRDFQWASSCIARMKHVVRLKVEMSMGCVILRMGAHAGVGEGTSSVNKDVGDAPIVISSDESSSDEN